MKKLFLLSVITLGLSSCSDLLDERMIDHIDPQLQPLVNNFFNEAAVRGIYVEKPYNVTIKFGNLDGWSGMTYHEQNLIVIDSTSLNWKINPEGLVFHECYHLYFRTAGHRYEVMGPYPKSIMTPFNGVDYIQHPERRQYYIDELFNPNISRPAWSF